MKEFCRRCNKDLNLELSRCDSLDELGHWMRQLIELHQNRWNSAFHAFSTPKYVHFHKSIAAIFFKRDWLRLYFLQDGATPIAAIYCYYYNGKYFYYQSGRNLKYSNYSVGIVLMNKVIGEAIKEGVVLFDFLTGDESYKFRWAQDVRKNVWVVLWFQTKDFIFSKALGFIKLLANSFKALKPR